MVIGGVYRGATELWLRLRLVALPFDECAPLETMCCFASKDLRRIGRVPRPNNPTSGKLLLERSPVFFSPESVPFRACLLAASHLVPPGTLTANGPGRGVAVHKIVWRQNSCGMAA
ncbi:unnamed protein product [Phaeothamnion confervicola]